MGRIIALVATALAASLLVATYVVTNTRGTDDAFLACRGTQVAGGAIGGPFELVNAAGQTVTDADVITGPTLLYFGYTFCPDVCPLDSARNAEAVDLLDARGIAATPVFISVDPERDSPEVAGQFASVFHPRMIGLSGSPEQIAAASKAYKTYYKKQDGDPEYYLVDHTTLSYLVFPDQGVVDFFRRDASAEAVADRIQCFVEAAGS